MGTDKAFVRLAGKPLIRHVIDCLAPQVRRLAISSNAPARSFAEFGMPVLADIHTGFQGPLAGIHAGLSAFPDDVVVSVAVDLPFLPADLATRLHDGWDGQRCRYLLCADRPALAILWPARAHRRWNSICGTTGASAPGSRAMDRPWNQPRPARRWTSM